MKKGLLLLQVLLLSFFIRAQDINYAKEIVAKLSSPDMYGRGYVNEGIKLTSNFIISELEKMNLKPEQQNYDVSVNTFPGNMSVSIDGIPLEATREYLIDPVSPSAEGEFKVITTSRREINTKEKFISLIKRTADAFILIDNNKDIEEEKEVTKNINDFINILKYSDQIPTKGVIIYTSDKLSWSSSDFLGPRPVIHVNKELQLNKVKSINLDIESKYYEKYETNNIVCDIAGTIDSDSLIVFTAHYDHLGMFGKSISFPGANDNASGVALLLNLAKHYATNPPKHNVRLIAFSANELNLRGSRYYIEKNKSELAKIKFLVNFDILGTGEEGINTVNGSVYKKQFNLLNEINESQSYLPKIDKRGKACNSDQCFFAEEGIPSFFIYTQGGIKAYHDLDDKADTLPLTEFEDLMRLMIDFEARL